MTQERAYEILGLGNRWANWNRHCTKEEHEFVLQVWYNMPGTTCWYDALVRIAKGKVK